MWWRVHPASRAPVPLKVAHPPKLFHVDTKELHLPFENIVPTRRWTPGAEMDYAIRPRAKIETSIGIPAGEDGA